jgi:hypothetical protein
MSLCADIKIFGSYLLIVLLVMLTTIAYLAGWVIGISLAGTDNLWQIPGWLLIFYQVAFTLAVPTILSSGAVKRFSR